MLRDLWLVRDWLHYWQTIGNPYRAFSSLDYPPGALLVLWPLAMLATWVAPLVLIPIVILSCAGGALLLVRWFSERLELALRWEDQAILVAVMLAGSSMRGAIWRGQTTPIAFLFGALALYLARRRPWTAAIMLALAAFKPHIAIGFALAILVTERRDVVLLAGALALSEFLLFAATVQESFGDVLALYVHNLIGLYAGPDRVVGLLSIRWVIEWVVGDFWIATCLYAALALGSLAFLISRVRRYLDSVTSTQLAVACLLWSLIFLPQQLYNGLLAEPALWLLMWPEARLIASARTRTSVVTALILFSVLDVPRTLRLLAAFMGGIHWLSMTALVLGPLRLALLFAFVLFRLAPRGSLLLRSGGSPAAT